MPCRRCWSRVTIDAGPGKPVCALGRLIHAHLTLRRDNRHLSSKGGLCMAHWTATQATESLVSLLGEARLILVSTREPYSPRWHRQVLAASAGGAAAPTGATNWEGARVRQASESQGSNLLEDDSAIRWSRPAGGL